MTQKMTVLNALAELQVGFAFKSSGFTAGPDGRRLLRGDNIGQGKTRWDHPAFWPYDEPVDARYELIDGDVVLAMDRPWIEAGLKFATISAGDLPALLVQRVARLRARPGTDQRYLHYVAASRAFTEHILAVLTGTAVPHVSGSQIMSYRLVAPPLGEQRAIAEVLGALDDKIAANRRVIATCERLSIALAATGRDLRQLSDIASRQVESVNPASFGDARVDLFSLPAFDEGRRPEKVEASIIKSNKVMLRQPCVLLTKLNPRIPRVWDIPELSDRLSLASPEFLALTPDACSSSVLWSVLCQARFLGELSSLVAGTSGSHQRVRPEEVMRLDVTDPASIDPGSRSAITALGTVIVNLRAESRTLAEARDSLLPLLMSGRVRVKDAETTVEGVV